MSSEKRYYVTTPIYYVNGRPHIGSGLTTLCCDFLKRYHAMRGRETWFLTGTDENATKNQEAAQEAGVEALEFVTGLAEEFRSAWRAMNYAFDDFIRTTEPRHVRAVQEVFRRLRDSGDLYRGMYEGWYCVSDETFFRDTDVKEDRLCPNDECRKPLRRVQEENYFFRLSAYGDRLLAHIEANPEFLQPDFRRNEVIAFIKQGLRDASVTRANNGWGIPVPDEPDKVIYVWFDALINYLAATGWPDDEEMYRSLWPADAHMMAKEIFVRFHATLWPAMLMALGLPLPRQVYAHGWWVSSEGKKEGKRTGGLPHPVEMAADIQQRAGAASELAVDAVRYLLLREMVFHGDSEFSRESFLRRYNTDLANDLGNLGNRTVAMVGRYLGGEVPRPAPDPEVGAFVRAAVEDYEVAVREFRFNAALEAAMRIVAHMNKVIEHRAPWALAKQGRTEELADVLYTCLEAVRVVSVLIAPAMPATSQALRANLGMADAAESPAWDEALQLGLLQPGTRVASPRPLFPRIQDVAPAQSAPSPAPSPAPAAVEKREEKPMGTPSTEPVSAGPATITFDDFAKLDLRVARVVEVEPVPNATKLLKLTVDLGTETRTILAGIAEMYQPDELKDKLIVVVANLQPRKMRGIESQGMLLAADVDGQAIILQPETQVPPGSRVR
ncbi:MAG: methionine--tRNA ligase [Chthonomonadales bacterium]|nr:methionine--tRNA ligase [Chthonomonadales bacterium]